MLIAVNTRLHQNQQPTGYKNLMYQLITNISLKYPQHQFIFITDKENVSEQKLQKNSKIIIAGPTTTNNISLQYWINFKLPKLLKQYRADVFISPELLCSLRTKIPQCMLITGYGLLPQIKLQKKWLSSLYKRNITSFLGKANGIGASSEFVKTILVKQYGINAQKICLVRLPINKKFIPLKWELQEKIKDKYTEGKSYFLFNTNLDDDSNHINLLKAFSFFKTRLKTNMQLLMVCKSTPKFTKELSSYKWRSQVKLLENITIDELAEITAGAYAVVHPVQNDILAIPVLQAMQCKVPVITADNEIMQSICEDAAFYCNTAQFTDIAHQMMKVYKEEEIVKQKVNSAAIIIQKHEGSRSTDALMKLIENSIDSVKC